MNTRKLAILMCIVLLAHDADAQQVPTEGDDPVAEAPFRLGVIAIDPRIGLTDLGVDNNVFNTTSNELRDFTFTVSPGTQLWMRTGKGLLTLDASAELVYFNQFASERSINSRAFGQYEMRFNRMRPYFSASTLNTRQRPGFEIDVRARHYETDFHGGTDIRIASRSTLRVDYRHLDYAFHGDEVFNGRALNQELNRTLQAGELSWRQRLTVLTTWVTRISRESERFRFDDARNADSFRITSGFELGRLALIRGSAFIGYRRLTPADIGVFPEFSGITADVDVAYNLPTQTRLGAAVDRDVQYSYESRTPYYAQTGWTITLTQRVTGRWDAQLLGGRDRLSYQAIDPADLRNDSVTRFGGGVGYTVGGSMRFSFDVQSLYRSSDLPGREYRGFRAGTSVTYGY